MRKAVAGKRLFHEVQLAIFGLSLAALFSVPQAVAQAALHSTTTHVSVNSLGTAATFDVKVARADGSVPSGTVTLWNGETPIAAAVLDKDGKANYTAQALTAGTRQVTATYSGDAQSAASTSAAAAVTAAAAGVPSFTIAANPATLTVKAGAYGTTVISVVPANGFNQNVTLSCSGLPLQATCTFSPVNVLLNANGSSAISTLNIQTQAPSGKASGMLNRDSHGSPMYAFLFPGAVALIGLGLLRKRTAGTLRMFGLALLLVGCSAGLGGCAARYSYFHKPPAGNPGTTLGTSSITIQGSGVASSGTLVTATTQITLTVN